MPDDNRLAALFADFEEAVMADIRLAGVDDTYATFGRRRRTRLVIGSAAAVLLVIAISAVTFLRPTPSSAPNVGVTPTVAPTPAGPEVERTVVGRGTTPLDNAKIDLPPFGDPSCPSGPTQFTKGFRTGPIVLRISDTADGPIDDDAQPDRVAVFRCGRSGNFPGPFAQVVAFDGPAEKVLGQVTTVTRASEEIRDVVITDDHVVRVLVAAKDGDQITGLVWRLFRWSGSDFESAGNVVVNVDERSTQLAITSSSSSSIVRTGDTFTVTVTNAGGPTLERIRLTARSQLALDLGPTASCAKTTECAFPPGAKRIASDVEYQWSWTYEPVQPEESGVIRFTVTLPAGRTDPTPLDLFVDGFVLGDIAVTGSSPDRQLRLIVTP